MHRILGIISSFEAHSWSVGKQSNTPFEIFLCHSNNFSQNDVSFEDRVIMFSDFS